MRIEESQIWIYPGILGTDFATAFITHISMFLLRLGRNKLNSIRFQIQRKSGGNSTVSAFITYKLFVS